MILNTNRMVTPSIPTAMMKSKREVLLSGIFNYKSGMANLKLKISIKKLLFEIIIASGTQRFSTLTHCT